MRMHINSDQLAIHRTVVLTSVRVVDTVTSSDLAGPTPCAGWTLTDLLAHMTVQHRGFAAAARGHGADLNQWDPATVADAVAADPGGTYADAAADVLDAFAAPGVLEASFVLPEMGPGATFPGSTAIAFHFIDYIAHGWDVARSLGRPFALPDDVVAAALPLVLAVPDGDFREAAGSPFGRAVPVGAPGGALDRILGHLGRSPAWTATASTGRGVD